MAIEQITLRFTGLQALITHNPREMNPRDLDAMALAKEKKAINAKRTNKTEEDIERLARIDWELGLYHDHTIGPYLPSTCVMACLREGAQATRKGKKLLAAVHLDAMRIPLEYDGPRDIEGLYADGRFFDYRGVGVKQARVMRARPIFPAWRAQFSLMVDMEMLNHEDVISAARHAGMYVGLCEMRPMYGRFSVEEVH